MDRSDDLVDGLARLELDATGVPQPDRRAEPDGYVVLVGERDRIHFLDWGGPMAPGPNPSAAAPGVLLVHGLASTAWAWTPVARRLRAVLHVVAMDLRGHGLSDAPVDGYGLASLAEDSIAVAEGSGLLTGGGQGVVLVGHGFGAIVAAHAGLALGPRCAGLVLVDGGWEERRIETGFEPGELLREIEEPPEVLRSMRAYLDDRRGYDPASWDDDQEWAARAAVVELPAGRVEPAIHRHVREAVVESMFEARPSATLAALEGPIVVLVAGDEPTRWAELASLAATLRPVRRGPIHVARFEATGHNLMRYRPAEVAAAVLAVTNLAPRSA